jgi:hypothetical protein
MMADKLFSIDINSPAQWPEKVKCGDCGGSGERCAHGEHFVCLSGGIPSGGDSFLICEGCVWFDKCPSCTDEYITEWYEKGVMEECENCEAPSDDCTECNNGYIYRPLTWLEIASEVEATQKTCNQFGECDMFDGSEKTRKTQCKIDCFRAIQTFQGKEIIKRKVKL